MAQPSTDSVSRAYELLANAHANNAKASMDFGNSIAQNLESIGKTALAYEQTQKDNEFRDQAHKDDIALKKRALANEESATKTRNRLINHQANAQYQQNKQNEVALALTHNKDTKTGEYYLKPNVRKQAETLSEDSTFLAGTINQSNISSPPSTYHILNPYHF